MKTKIIEEIIKEKIIVTVRGVENAKTYTLC